jgi:hypothetical protein
MTLPLDDGNPEAMRGTSVVCRWCAVTCVSAFLQFNCRRGRWPSEHQDESPNIQRFPREAAATEEKTSNGK